MSTETADILRRGTGGGGEVLQEVKISRTLSSAELERAVAETERASFEKWKTSYLFMQARGDHSASISREWQARTSESAKSSARELLTKLADLGFAWRDIAKMIGVSVPAIQKWRRGEGVSGTNRMKLASLVAGCELIQHQAPSIRDVASWFEVPMHASAPVTPIDLWADNRPELTLEYALGHESAADVLTQWDSSWRERYTTSVITATGADGQPILIVGSD